MYSTAADYTAASFLRSRRAECKIWHSCSCCAYSCRKKRVLTELDEYIPVRAGAPGILELFVGEGALGIREGWPNLVASLSAAARVTFLPSFD